MTTLNIIIQKMKSKKIMLDKYQEDLGGTMIIYKKIMIVLNKNGYGQKNK